MAHVRRRVLGRLEGICLHQDVIRVAVLVLRRITGSSTPSDIDWWTLNGFLALNLTLTSPWFFSIDLILNSLFVDRRYSSIIFVFILACWVLIRLL